MSLTTDVIIPALNEAAAIGQVLDAIPRDHVRRVVVADNGSTDGTAEIARVHGAEIVYQRERGYGAACLRAMDHLRFDPPEVLVFLDGDFSDHPEELPRLVEPIAEGLAELVIGSRTRGDLRGGLTLQQRVGNRIACSALQRFYGAEYTDLGPFRAIRWDTLLALGMKDRNYGWTVEMQIKAARRGVRHLEVPVSYRARIGESKVSGTLLGTLGASRKILWQLGRHALPSGTA